MGAGHEQRSRWRGLTGAPSWTGESRTFSIGRTAAVTDPVAHRRGVPSSVVTPYRPCALLDAPGAHTSSIIQLTEGSAPNGHQLLTNAY